MGTGIGEKGISRERNRIPRRRQRLSVFIAMALLMAFLLQLATYCTIQEDRRSLVQNCGNDCREKHASFSTLRIPSIRQNEAIMNQRKKLDAKRHEKSSKTSNAKSMLIVGGSDGSGTRAIVEVLRRLGTVIVSEDPQTFDVSANEIFHSSFDGHIMRGWPSLIERSFSNFGRKGFFQSITSSPGENKTLSINFNWPPPPGNLEKEIQMDMANGIQVDVKRLIVNWNDKYNDIVNSQTSQQSSEVSTMNVTYAIKAPASMLVLPIFAYMQQQEQQQDDNGEERQRLKFLHIIRDGRDVALSDNQSPVIKFYNLTYPSNHSRRKSLASFLSTEEELDHDSITHAKAIQLWNDWNVNVYQWAKHSKDIDYLWIRSEDLLVPGSPERLDTMAALTQFVGSTIPQAELCALSNMGTIDYGQSMRTASRSILHSKAGVGEMDVFAKWELQNRDAEKRMKEQQRQQSVKRRLTEDKQIMSNQFTKPIAPQVVARPISNVRSTTVRNRYGKWKSILETKSSLREFFYQEGKEGLNIFGYHPYRRILYTDGNPSVASCGDSVVH